jgi:hypothetical protein
LGIINSDTIRAERPTVIEERKAKALFAGGVALFVTGLVVLMLFVMPAGRQAPVAEAQEFEEPYMDDFGPNGEFMDDGMGMGEVDADVPLTPARIVPPLEPSRPNPFAPRIGVDVGVSVTEAARVAAPTRYGPDWSRLPIAERVAFVPPGPLPTPPTPPLPVIPRPAEATIRITSILWDATGQALAAYEDDAGRTGQLRPGDQIQGFVVREITRTGVTLEHPRTGEVQRLEIRPRTEAPPQPSPARGAPRQQRFPDAP